MPPTNHHRPPARPRRGVSPATVALACAASLAVGVGAGYVLPRGGTGGGETDAGRPVAGGGPKAGAPAPGGPGGVRGWVPKEVADFVVQRLGGDLEYTTANYPFVSRIFPKGSNGGYGMALESDWPQRLIEFCQPGDDQAAERRRRNHAGSGVMLTKANWVFVTDPTTAARLRPILEQLPQ